MSAKRVCSYLEKGGKTITKGGVVRITRWDSSYNDTANALIEASKKSAIDFTRREIIIGI